MTGRTRLPLILLLIVVLLVAGGIAVFWPHLEGDPPAIELQNQSKYIGRLSKFTIVVTDEGRGLARLDVLLEQDGSPKVLLEENFPADSLLSPGQTKAHVDLDIKAVELGLRQGPAKLIIIARDRSMAGWMAGNEARLEVPLIVDTKPPRLSVLSGVIHLNRGGVGCVVYTLDETDAVHGVMVGDHLFPGHAPWPKRPEARMCLFAFGDTEPKDAPIKLVARDSAGNSASSPLNVRLKWKNFRTDKINLSDGFLASLAPRFSGQAPEADSTPLKAFIWVNEKLRQADHEVLTAAAAKTEPYQLWQETFIRPRGKPMSGFGDRRIYFYQGKEVSQGRHLGVDLADTANTPIDTVAAGVVRFAGYQGIYGNCVIIDHGQGLATLYGHMSRLDVQPGQNVARGDQIGLSGATGLALGDHLHFSVLVDGVFVNPAEWWDPHWIADNVFLRYSEAGLPRPTPPAGEAAKADSQGAK